MAEQDQLDSQPQSFVVRMWEEEHGRWRGKVKHVQSQEQRGFSRVSQLTEIIEQWLNLSAGKRSHEPAKANVGVSPLRFLLGQRVQMAGLAAALLAVCGFALLFSSPGSSAPLAGTAVGGNPAWETVTVFLAGVVLGGILVASFRPISRR